MTEIYRVHLYFANESEVCRTTTDNGSNFIKAFNVFGKMDKELLEEVQEEEEEGVGRPMMQTLFRLKIWHRYWKLVPWKILNISCRSTHGSLPTP